MVNHYQSLIIIINRGYENHYWRVMQILDHHSIPSIRPVRIPQEAPADFTSPADQLVVRPLSCKLLYIPNQL